MKTIGKITIHHGNGGAYMKALITELFARYFDNEFLSDQADSAILPSESGTIAFTTDSFVVDPLFFPGGNIGTLAICGTLNDLSVCGATPAYISAGFIIEEGFGIKTLERVVRAMASEAQKASVKIVTGDTKVVNRGKCDKLFINTSGIGVIHEKHHDISKGLRVQPGDQILLNGSPGQHGMAVLNARGLFNFKSGLKSDCSNLYPLISQILSVSDQVHFMRDATRGGVATVLTELAIKTNLGISIEENAIPVDPDVRVMCEILGFDPLYLANEGKVIVVVGAKDAVKVLSAMKREKTGKDAAIIGEITGSHKGKPVLRTIAGGSRLMEELMGDQLPRIC